MKEIIANVLKLINKVEVMMFIATIYWLWDLHYPEDEPVADLYWDETVLC